MSCRCGVEAVAVAVRIASSHAIRCTCRNSFIECLPIYSRSQLLFIAVSEQHTVVLVSRAKCTKLQVRHKKVPHLAATYLRGITQQVEASRNKACRTSRQCSRRQRYNPCILIAVHALVSSRRKYWSRLGVHHL